MPLKMPILRLVVKLMLHGLNVPEAVLCEMPHGCVKGYPLWPHKNLKGVHKTSYKDSCVTEKRACISTLY